MTTIMIIGNWKWSIYEEALASGFTFLDIQVLRYSYDEYNCADKAFDLRHPIKHWRKVVTINSKIVRKVLDKQPNMIFFYRGGFIFPETIKKLKKKLPKTVICLYHNDNPYEGIKNRLKYLFFLQSLQYSDISYVYRPANIKDCIKFKAANPKLLMSHSYTKYHWWKKKNILKKYDIVFIGHYEDDSRIEYIDKLYKTNIDLHVFGPAWENIFKKYNWPKTNCHKQVYGDKYRETISSARIALVFLSQKNKDVYTRRCFEIPACGTAMLLPYTFFLEKLFPKNTAAIYYSNPQTITSIVRKILIDSEKLKTIAINAHKIAQDHNEIARAKQITEDYKQF